MSTSTKATPTKTVNNHVGQAKTEAITCQGIGKDKDGKIRYADDHEEFRLVYKQDAKQTKRCVACQKVYKKERQSANAKKRNVAKALITAVAEGKKAQATFTKCGAKMSKKDQDSLKATIKAGKDAAVSVAKVK